MKIKITIEGSDTKLFLTPDSELEKLVIQELGDDIGISRSHQSLVLRRRANHVRTIEDDAFPEEEAVGETSTLKAGNGRL